MKILKDIPKLFLNQVADFFPYFFTFYILSFTISLFSESWRLFFNWSMFHLSVATIAILAIFSQKFRSTNVFKLINIKKNKLIKRARKFFLKRRIFNKINYLKISIIFLILNYSILNGIYIIELIILLFALISLIFIKDYRIIASESLLLLLACPILLFFKKDALAEIFALYAYYFLIIIVIDQIREYIKIKIQGH